MSRKTTYLAAYVISLLGLFVCWMLSVSYLFQLQLPCGGSQGCTAVALSPAARIGGVPIPVFGCAFYLAMTVLFGRLVFTGKAWSTGLTFSSALAAAAVSTGFTAYAALALHAECVWCLANNVLACLLALVLSVDRKPPEASKPKRGALFLIVTVSLALLAMGVGVQAVRRNARRFPWNPVALARTSVAELAPEDSVLLSGAPGSPTVVIFMDLQCPACQTAFPALYALALKDRLRLAVRNRPHKVHQDALAMSVLFEEAAQQGKGLPYLQALLNSDLPDAAAARKVMAQIGATQTPALRTEARCRIVRDSALAKQLGLTLTPSIFLLQPGRAPRPAPIGTLPSMLGAGS